MVSKKRNLGDALGNLGSGEEPELRRGEGVYLSTEEATTVKPQPVIEERKIEAPARSKLGYEIRRDFQKDIRRIALETDRHAYEIVEDALEQYIKAYSEEEKKK